MKFVDVFAGTGTVTASVDANEKVVNDKEVGVACFLYCLTHDELKITQLLALLHNNFVSEDFSEGKNRDYTMADWFCDKKKNEKYNKIKDIAYDRLSNRLRNNYINVFKTYEGVVKKTYDSNISNPPEENIEAIYFAGTTWYFLNSIPKNFYDANKYNHRHMEVDNYYSYLKKCLGIFETKGNSEDECKKKYGEKKYEIIRNLRLEAKDIKLGETKEFMKSLKGMEIYIKDFKDIMSDCDNCFVYLDSPYFMTTQYSVGFNDEEHKKMLDLLRKAGYKWLFSMQYYEGSTKKVKNVRRPRLPKNHPLIKDYDNYYKGFVNEFHSDEEGYWVVDDDLDEERLGLLYVILFKSTKSNEMMICNFDARNAIKYGLDAAILPMDEFLKLESSGASYEDIYSHAVEWRAGQIIKKFSYGEIV